jgi:uncharacterized membrane protein YeaQ/YmgE (transglycosylase-associated protein family)
VQIQDYVVAIVFGAIIGVIARAILPGRQAIGVIPTIVVGAAAAFAGTWASDRWDLHSSHHFAVNGHQFDWAVLGVQIGIAVVGVAIAAVISRVFTTDRD